MKKNWTTVKDFEGMARESHYRVEEFARKLGMSRRWVQELFRREFGKSPRALFALWRAREIEQDISHGKPRKQIVGEYGLQHTSSLSRAIKRDVGHGLRTRP